MNGNNLRDFIRLKCKLYDLSDPYFKINQGHNK